VQAPFVHWMPARSIALHLPSILWSTLATWLVYAVGTRLLSSKWRAALACWLFATGSAFVVFDGVRSQGAYNAALVVGLMAMWLAVRTEGQPSLSHWLALGILTGLGTWLSLVSVYLLAPAALLIANRARSRLVHPRHLGPITASALTGWLIGYSPGLGWALSHGTLPFATVQSTDGPVDRLHGLVGGTLPEILGLKWVGASSIGPGWLSAAAVSALAALWLYTGVRQRAAVLRLLRLRARVEDWPAVLHVAGVVVITCYLVSPFTWFTSEPRYLYLAAPLIVWGLAAAFPPQADRSSRKWVVLGALLVVACSLLTATTLQRAAQRAPSSWSRDFATAADWMGERGVHTAYADYRAAYTLDYLSNGRVTTVPFGPAACRLPHLNDVVDNSPVFAYVLSDADRREHLAQLAQHGMQVRDALTTRTLIVLIPVNPDAVRPWQVGLMRPSDRCSPPDPGYQPSGSTT
jgi:hypothetical protein